MPSLNALLEKQVQKVPGQLLRRLLEKKLREQGIEEKAFLDSLTQHILTQSGETFYWNNGEEGPITNLRA